MELQNKVFAITGGGQGLGRAMSLRLASLGANIAVVDLNQDALSKTVELCREAGAKAEGYAVNVADEESVKNLFQEIPETLGRLDGLVNNAGITRDGLMVKAKGNDVIKTLSLEDWNAVIQVNLTGVFLCAREAASKMIQLGNGGILINISSISKAGNIGQTNYSAAKAGVAAMTVTWAKELAKFKIRSNAIAPGFIETEMTSQMPPEVLEKITNMIPAKRMGSPDEIAHTVQYLIENDYMNGRVIEMDGALRL